MSSDGGVRIVCVGVRWCAVPSCDEEVLESVTEEVDVVEHDRAVLWHRRSGDRQWNVEERQREGSGMSRKGSEKAVECRRRQ